MHAVAPQPRALVEAVLARPRLGHEDRQLEDRALRRRAPHGQLEQDRLTHVPVAEALDAPGNAERELRAASRPRHRHASDAGPPDLRRHGATVDRLEPQRADPRAREREAGREQCEPRPWQRRRTRPRGRPRAGARSPPAPERRWRTRCRRRARASRRCGTWTESFPITARRAPEAPRRSPARSRARRRAPRPTETPRARRGDRGSSVPSRDRPRAACPAARASPRSG